MINRLLIRIKVVQMVYAYMQNGQAGCLGESDLMRSMESAYNLYNYLLALVVKITDYRKEQLEAAKNRYTASAQDKCPNMRFVENKIASMILNRSNAVQFCEEHKLLNDFDTEMYRSLMNDIMEMPAYESFMNSKEYPTTFEADKNLWKEIFNTVIPFNSQLDATLEEKSIYWNDDLCVINAFVVKTIQKMSAGDETIKTFAMFKSDEDKKFAVDLFYATIQHIDEYLEMINSVSENWEVNRIAFMDRIIMACALAEIKTFNDIPVKISMNEYIELAKYYSTPTSARFINGLLDRIVKNLKKEGLLLKA